VTRRLAFTFPGQGSQRPGMLDMLPETDGIDRLLDAAEALSGLPLRRIASEGPTEDLSDTRAAQPLLYLADWTWGAAMLDAGLEPVALAGHSLGELAALAVAGVYSVEAGLELVVERSRLMAEAAASTPGGMSAILGMQRSEIELALSELADVWVANDNAPGQTVISGTPGALETAEAVLIDAGARKVVRLAVSGPFHTPLMKRAADAFSATLAQAQFSDASIPVIQNAEPTYATDAATIRARLAAQIISPVRWTETMQALSAEGQTLLVEAGPGTVLTGLAKRVDGVEGLSAEQIGIEKVAEEVFDDA
jgi:[acyl-carrier-protein] S-malonyltransferase